MQIASIIVLFVLPGSWLTFWSKRSPLSYNARLALSVTLSPLVVALQFYGLRLAGLTFEQTVPILSLLNLGSLILIIRSFRHSRPELDWRRMIVGGSLFLSVAACVAIPWIWAPEFRQFSWHGLLHTDIIYAFARGDLLPQESELAGVVLAYPWMGHLFWSVLAWTADLSPTIIYVLSNLVLLAVTGVLSYAFARELGASEQVSFAVPVILALGTNLPGLIGWSVIPANDSGIWWAFLGDLRYAPFLLKFVTFEPMTFGLALFAGLVLVSVVSLTNSASLELLLAPVIVASIGVIYPNLFPAAALLLFGLFVAVWLDRQDVERSYSRATILALLVLSGLAAIVGIWAVKLYTGGSVGGAFELSSPAALAKKTLAAILALSPFILGTVWMWQSEPSRRRPALLVLGFGACGALALNLLMRIGGLNEYKFFMVAGMCLVAPAAIGFERAVHLSRQRLWQIVAILPAVLALVMISYAINRAPRHVEDAFDVQERSFWLSLVPANPAADWTDAIRSQTPTDTVVVVNDPGFHTPPFTGRPLFVPPDGETYYFGYNQTSRFNLLELRGYDDQLFENRLEVQRRIYTTDSAAEVEGLWQHFTALKRPLAIVFKAEEGRAFQLWLQGKPGATELVRSPGGRVVYFISS